MKKIAFTAITGGLVKTDAVRRANVDAAVARCVLPIDEEEGRAWDAIVAQRAKAA